MGIDACFFIKVRQGVDIPRLGFLLPQEFSFQANPEYGPIGATHEILNPHRYYGKVYSRGCWPQISACLMLLMTSPDIETVWYCGDSFVEIETSTEAWTIEKHLEYTRFFLENGTIPYRGEWESRR